ACTALAWTPTSLNNGALGTTFNQSLSASGGTAPYDYSILNGALPNGVSFTAGGVLSGTPTQTGAFNFTVKAQDAVGCTGTQAYTLTINCPALSVNPATLGAATAGAAFNQTFTQTGGTGAIAWSFTGTLPAGLTLNAATGELAGTPSVTGNFSFTITATDANNCTGSRALSLTVNCPTITLTPGNLTNGGVGLPYNQTISASPAGAYSYTVTAGNLPAGLTLNSSTGVLSGTPSTAGAANFTITATGFGACVGSQAYALTTNCPAITVNPATLGAGTAGTAFSQTFTQTGGSGTIIWSSTGALPAGLTLNAVTGELAGTPTVAGNFSFNIIATDANNCTGSRSLSLTINCPAITLTPATLSSGSEGAPYSQALTQTGATGTVTWSVSAGTLPNGLSLNAGSGLLSGSTLAAGTFNFTVRATGGNGCFGERAYALVVANCPALTLTPGSLPNVRLGNAYSQTLTASGGQTPYAFSVTTGILPTGVTLATNGLLAGTPTQSGTFAFTVTVRDANHCSGTLSYTLMVERGLVQADFDGDGRTDLSVWRPGNGAWYSLNSSNDAARVQSWGAGYAPYNDVIVPGDYDGDGKTDYAVWRGQTSVWYIRPSATPEAPILREFGAAYAPYFDVPVPGDYDGDGKTDIAVWRPTTGTWFVWKSSDGGYLITAWGTQGDIPVPGDYDGDGKTDIAQWRPSDGVWYIKNSSGGTQIIEWGAGVAPYFDVPVPADYDGDGKTDCAVWRKQSGTWYIRQSADAKPLVQAFGAPYAPYNDLAAPGDYDGDGKADIAVWRSSDGNWYVLRSSTGTALVKAFGQLGDMPVPASGAR
ncbi:MAG: putative Ig domain-containing protein, partial [Acidobacteria bacterium]|nr:putative Ig domain-containing protein [Acidobacteriota bacterium]